mmetsp:Transcript_83359/g.222955  ORF Transcript_83359/g.222955 Transcript_83359/m.222955 type:complete len:348 (-) Transcript_83359:396-1439(-)
MSASFSGLPGPGDSSTPPNAPTSAPASNARTTVTAAPISSSMCTRFMVKLSSWSTTSTRDPRPCGSSAHAATSSRARPMISKVPQITTTSARFRAWARATSSGVPSPLPRRVHPRAWVTSGVRRRSSAAISAMGLSRAALKTTATRWVGNWARTARQRAATPAGLCAASRMYLRPSLSECISNRHGGDCISPPASPPSSGNTSRASRRAVARYSSPSTSSTRVTVAAPTSAAMPSRSPGVPGPRITWAPRLKIPPFSRAISSTVSPKNRIWSRATEVMTHTVGWTMLVLSNRPPIPHSTTAAATARSRKYRKATTVRRSKAESFTPLMLSSSMTSLANRAASAFEIC